jgi:hypothetical protein
MDSLRLGSLPKDILAAVECQLYFLLNSHDCPPPDSLPTANPPSPFPDFASRYFSQAGNLLIGAGLMLQEFKEKLSEKPVGDIFSAVHKPDRLRASAVIAAGLGSAFAGHKSGFL